MNEITKAHELTINSVQYAKELQHLVKKTAVS